MRHESRFVWYDLIRGVSALAVLASHLRAMLLVDFTAIQNPNPAHKIFYFLSGLGHEAVMVFFVLSGFFVGGNVIKNREKFSWVSYANARLCRLYVVLIPALVLTLILDTVTGWYAPGALEGSLTAIWNSGPTPARPWSMDLATFTGNVFFVQTILTQVLGTNSPLWSLAYEFWYYVLFPLAFTAMGLVKASAKTRIISAGLALGLAAALPSGILASGIIWSFGVLLSIMPSPRTKFAVPLVLVLSCCFFTSLVATKTNQVSNLAGEFLVAVCFTLLAIFLKGNTGRLTEVVKTPARWLSEVSFSLYVVHFPIVFLAGAVWYKGKQWQPDGTGMLLFFAWFVGIVLAGGCFWWLFERHTNRIRFAIADRLQNAKTGG